MHPHKSIGLIYLLISIIPENVTSIGQSFLELLSKIAKFDLLTSDKSAILDRALSQTIELIYLLIYITPENLKSIDQSVLKLSCKQESAEKKERKNMAKCLN